MNKYLYNDPTTKSDQRHADVYGEQHDAHRDRYLRELNINNPLYPPCLKGDVEGESPNFKRELVGKTRLLLAGQ
jgi:hypothetical protein